MTMTKPQRAADRAHSYLREEIMQGRLAPGTMLSENDLAATLSMSRTPVRAALARLQDEGWVRIYPQRGALVRALTEQEVRESAEVRHALESAGVQRSAPERRAALAERLGANIVEQGAALTRGDFAGFTVLAMAFHRGFVELAGNQTMLALYDRLQDQQQLSIVRSAGRISGDPQWVLEQHRTLLRLAVCGDWVGFAASLRDHQAES